MLPQPSRKLAVIAIAIGIMALRPTSAFAQCDDGSAGRPFADCTSLNAEDRMQLDTVLGPTGLAVGEIVKPYASEPHRSSYDCRR